MLNNVLLTIDGLVIIAALYITNFQPVLMAIAIVYAIVAVYYLKTKDSYQTVPQTILWLKSNHCNIGHWLNFAGWNIGACTWKFRRKSAESRWPSGWHFAQKTGHIFSVLHKCPKKLRKRHFLHSLPTRQKWRKSYEKRAKCRKKPGLDKSFASKSCKKRTFWKKPKMVKKLRKRLFVQTVKSFGLFTVKT